MNKLHRTNAIILQDRIVFGEFHHLYNQVRCDDALFQSYTRMSVETFDYIFEIIRPEFDLRSTNFQDPITVEERLVVMHLLFTCLCYKCSTNFF